MSDPTLGMLLFAVMHPADVQDRDGGLLVLAGLGNRFPLLEKIFADGGYNGPKFSEGVAAIRKVLNIEIVKRSDAAKGAFVLLPWRWLVERTLAFLKLASIRLMVRKLCQIA